MKKLLLGLCLSLTFNAFSHDFSTTIKGQRIYFEITNPNKRTVAVTYNGNIKDKKVPELKGVVEIPSKIKHNNKVYEVTAIGSKAFANAKRLKGVVISSGIERIGDFAFENCDSLESVVFPGRIESLGQGIFFNCHAISDVVIGSDWKTVDFSMFRWSDALREISIPAKVEKIQGIKKLKGLERINVESANQKFLSVDGILYNKNATILYACPRNYEGDLKIIEGTNQVLSGALIDCCKITTLDFPKTLKNISFRETSRMKNLESIIMRAEMPIVTAYYNGEGKFLFQLANPKTQILILTTAKNAYEKVLPTEAGEYREKKDGVPYFVSASELTTKKNLKGVKNFNNY